MTEIEQRALEYFREHRDTLERDMCCHNTERDYVTMPLLFEGIWDMIRWNVRERCFDKIILLMAKDDVVRCLELNDTSAHAGIVEYLEVDIPPQEDGCG